MLYSPYFLCFIFGFFLRGAFDGFTEKMLSSMILHYAISVLFYEILNPSLPLSCIKSLKPFQLIWHLITLWFCFLTLNTSCLWHNLCSGWRWTYTIGFTDLCFDIYKFYFVTYFPSLTSILKPGDAVHLVQTEIMQHFTQPPPRYSEASLVCHHLSFIGISGLQYTIVRFAFICTSLSDFSSCSPLSLLCCIFAGWGV